jgi:hypothetical protein
VCEDLLSGWLLHSQPSLQQQQQQAPFHIFFFQREHLQQVSLHNFIFYSKRVRQAAK